MTKTGARQKVAYILTPITFGGAEKVSLNFLRGVDRGQFDIHPILLTRPWEEKPYFARCLEALGYSYDTVPVARKTGEGPFRVARVASRFHSILKGNGSFDLVHTHGYFADICGLPVARLLGIPGMSTCHGFIENDNALRAYNRMDTIALRLCKTIIAVSGEIGARLVQKGIPSSRVVVIPNAAAPPPAEGLGLRRNRQNEIRVTAGIGPNDRVAGYIGRLSEEKGVGYLVESIADLRDAGLPFKLILVGDGPEKAALEQRIKAGNLEDHVFLAGFQADTEAWLSVFDMFVLPSLTEGTPMALLEAMAAGVPVIATSVGGVPGVLTDGVNGFLVPPANERALADKISLLAEDPGLCSRFAKAGEDTIRYKYGFEAWCRAIERLYCTVGKARVETAPGIAQPQ